MTKPTLKGVSILYDEVKRKRYVQIDLVTIAREPEAVEDLIDGLIAESRRSEPALPHEAVERRLYKRKKK